jgi:2'-5' RNA ligase
MVGRLNEPSEGELEPFGNIRLLRNHWSRPIGPRAYYWYLTFATAPGLHALTAECQRPIAFPYYDLIPPSGLHLTLERIGFESTVTPAQLNAIEAAARRACQVIPPFTITVGALGGTRGAIGFSVSPAHPVRELRDALRAATLSACPAAPVTPHAVDPHVTIAYANTDDVPAADVITAVGKLNASAARAAVAVDEAALVLLERRERSYAWQAVSRVALTG